MTQEPSLWSFISNAGPVVKVVLLILLSASIASWSIIIQRAMLFKQSLLDMKDFEKRFWSGIDLNELFKQISKEGNPMGLAAIFFAGFHEFLRLCQKSSVSANAIMEGTQRSMRVAEAHEVERLERHLTFLATVGSTSPYVGLFGTVWGIMNSFRGLGAVQQATISMVAPGISEALIATAFGLFAAIPAVVAYNRFSNKFERLSNNYTIFQEELTTILHRKTHASDSR